MPDDKMYADLAAATTPEEVMSVLDQSGATLSYDSEPPADGLPPMDEPPVGEDEGPMSEEYSDGEGAPETGRRASILAVVKKNLNKSKPDDDEGAEKEE